MTARSLVLPRRSDPRVEALREIAADWALKVFRACEEWILPFLAGVIVRFGVGLRRKTPPPLRIFLSDLLFGGIAAVTGWFAAGELKLGRSTTWIMVTACAVLGYSLVDKLTKSTLCRLEDVLKARGGDDDKEKPA